MNDVNRDDFDQYAAAIALYVDRLATDGWLHPAAAKLLRAELEQLRAELERARAERDALLPVWRPTWTS